MTVAAEIKDNSPKDKRIILFLIATTLLFSLPLLVFGLPMGPDGEIHATWARSFASVLNEGTLYPRWLPDLFYGAGSPAFFFYSPISYYLSYPFVVLLQGTIPLPYILGICTSFFMILSSITFYYSIKPFLPAKAASFASLAYAILPYHYSEVIIRHHRFAEAAAYIFLPLCFSYAFRINEKKNNIIIYSFIYSLLLMTHLCTGVIVFHFLLSAGIIFALMGKFKKTLLLGSGMLLGICLSSVYLLPAIFLQDHVSINSLWLPSHIYFNNFIFAKQDYAGMIIMFTYIYIIFISFVTLRNETSYNKKYVFTFIFIASAVFFMMSKSSIRLWDMLAVLQKIQFPTRLCSLLDITLCVALGFSINTQNRNNPGSKRLEIIFIPLIFAIIFFTTAALVRKASSLYPLASPTKFAATNLAFEHGVRGIAGASPFTAEYIPAYSSLPSKPVETVSYLHGATKISIVQWKSRSIQIKISNNQPESITIGQYYFPFWNVIDTEGQEYAISPSPELGLISFALPPGEHLLQLQLVWNKYEIAGLIISILALVFCLLFLLRHRIPLFAGDSKNSRFQSSLPD